MAEGLAADVSPALRGFVGGLPYERGPILAFMRRTAAELPPGSRVLDVGAGDSPYRELFAHVEYRTTDWEHSVHPGARRADYVGPADEIAVEDASFDAVLLTQVLEHVPDPGAVLRELLRVLRPGGRLFMTVPLTWELHELPFDFFRYTAPGLQRLLQDAGFAELDIEPRNDCFTTVAQLLHNIGLTMGRYPDGRDAEREHAVASLAVAAEQIAALAPLDARRILPLGYSVRALRPDPDAAPPAAGGSAARAAAGLHDTRGFVVLAFADEVLADPAMLAAYGERFGDGDDVTLVLYAPGVDVAQAEPRLLGAVTAAGLQAAGAADLLALPISGGPGDEAALARAVDAVFARRPPRGAFHRVAHFHDGELDALRRLAVERAGG